MKNVFFWTEVAVYLKHGMRQVHSYYGLLMESHRWYPTDRVICGEMQDARNPMCSADVYYVLMLFIAITQHSGKTGGYLHPLLGVVHPN